MWNPAKAPTPYPPTPEPTPARTDSMAAHVTSAGQQSPAYIGKSLHIKGEGSGSKALHIDGRVEGFVRLDGAYLNVGPGAMVKANVSAREVVIRGEVTGNVTTTERLDIRSGGSLVGDIVAHSVSIEEGAYFKGSIDMRRVESPRPQPVKTTAVDSEPKAMAAVASA